MFDTWASYEPTRAFVTSSFLWQRRGSDFPLLARILPEMMKTTRFLAGLPLEKAILAKRCHYPQPRPPRGRTARPVAGRLLEASPPTNKKRGSPEQPALSFLSFANAFLALFAQGSSRTTSGAVRTCERLFGKARPPRSGSPSRSGRSPTPVDASHQGRLSPPVDAYPCLRSKSTLLVCSQLSTVPVSKPSSGSTTSAYISSSRSTSSSASVS